MLAWYGASNPSDARPRVHSRLFITEEEVMARVNAWLATRPGAEHGDAVGRPLPIPWEPR